MIRSDYVPDRGDLVWLDFSPHAGHEQGGRRPAIVISPRLYNLKSGLGLFCPITSKAKGYPFEVSLPEGLGVQGVVLADHVKSTDWVERDAAFLCKVPDEVVQEAIARIGALFDL